MAEAIAASSESTLSNVKIRCKDCNFLVNRFKDEILWKFIVSKERDPPEVSESKSKDVMSPTTTKPTHLLENPSHTPLLSFHDSIESIENTQPSTSSTNSLLTKTKDDEEEEDLLRENVEKISLPEWITKGIVSKNWEDGRLLCFGCHSHLGRFDLASPACKIFLWSDFVKIDELCWRDVEDDDNLRPSQCSLTFFEGDISTNFHMLCYDESEGSSPSLVNTRREVSAEKEVVNRLSKRHKYRQIKRLKDSFKKERFEVLKEKYSDRALKLELIRQKEKKDSRLKQLLEGEPELQELSDDLVCPVCLDLLHEPHQVEPCGHTFCEPCLRRLGQKSPMNCSCPLCRTRIGFCNYLVAKSKDIRENHHGLYMRRKTFESGTPVLHYPLPWRPGWRNLIRGRPLGGNQFLPRDNLAELMRAILLQIPYYLRPIVIIDFINVGIFAFMVGLIEVVPSIISLFFTIHTINSTAVANLTLDVDETSGDQPPLDADPEHDPAPDQILSKDDPINASFFDSTVCSVLFSACALAILAGCFNVGHQIYLRRHRMSDLILLAAAVACLPLLVFPIMFLPFRDGDAMWLGDFLFWLGRLLLNHMNYHTVVFLILHALLLLLLSVWIGGAVGGADAV